MQARYRMRRPPVRPICAGLPDPNSRLLSIIREWARTRGSNFPMHWEVSRLDEDFAQFCADVHEHAKHTPSEFRTRESYRILIEEIEEQYRLLVEAGYTISIWRREGQPYRDSCEMRNDVRDNRRLFVYPTSGLPPDHPLAALSRPGWTWNDVFRAVHDLVGHAATGFQFGPMGEENAFRFHATLQSSATLPALAAETRLQNCWVNFGPHLRGNHGKRLQPGDPDYIPPITRPYAAQKAFSPVAAAIDCSLWRHFRSSNVFRAGLS
jgi:hypothetical protein